jgi:prevent-host-death family protein
MLYLDQPGLNGYNRFVYPSKLCRGKSMIINLSEAKTQLSKLVDMAHHGEKIIIAKNNLPLVELIAYKPTFKRKLGLLKGKIHIPDNFLDEDEEINALFYGDV